MLFTDTFDDIVVFDDLFALDGSRWTSMHPAPNTGPVVAGTKVELSTLRAHSGSQSIRCLAKGGPPPGQQSKASLIKENFFFDYLDKTTITAWFYVPGVQAITNATFLDLECSVCWDNTPGVRLLVVTENGKDYFEFNRSKLGFTTGLAHFPRTADVEIPRDRWFKITWEVTLGIGDLGGTRVWIDDDLMMDSDLLSGGWDKTTVVDAAYWFSEFGITPNQEKIYDRWEVGCSANSLATDIELWFDDVVVTATKPSINVSPCNVFTVKREPRVFTVMPSHRTITIPREKRTWNIKKSIWQ